MAKKGQGNRSSSGFKGGLSVTAGLSKQKQSSKQTKKDRGLSLKEKLKRDKQKAAALKKKRKETAATITTGAVEGTPSATIDPFMTAEDMMNMGDSQARYESSLADSDYELEQQRLATEQGKADIEFGRVRNIKAAEESAASRGIARSSVRDSNLWDIDATAAFGRSQLDTKLNTATMAAERQKGNAIGAWTRFQIAMNQKQVENAQGIAEENGPWAVEPVAGTTTANPALQKIKEAAEKQKKAAAKHNKAAQAAQNKLKATPHMTAGLAPKKPKPPSYGVQPKPKAPAKPKKPK